MAQCEHSIFLLALTLVMAGIGAYDGLCCFSFCSSRFFCLCTVRRAIGVQCWALDIERATLNVSQKFDQPVVHFSPCLPEPETDWHRAKLVGIN